MKLFSVKLTYVNGVVVHVGCERRYKTAKKLMDRLLLDLCYLSGMLSGEIEAREVSFREWLGAK